MSGKQCNTLSCANKVLLYVLSAAFGSALTYGIMSCNSKRSNPNYAIEDVNATAEDTKNDNTTQVIEHSKPLAERTYEQQKLLGEYLLMHFGEKVSGNFNVSSKEELAATGNFRSLDVGRDTNANFGDFSILNLQNGQLEAPQYPHFALDFPTRVAQLCAYFTKNTSRALDIGCAVGRTAFELSATFDAVLGVDYSYMFVNAAKQLAAGQKLEYNVPVEGSITFRAEATLNPHVRPEVCTFAQGDATNLDPYMGTFDCIVGANLIDRLPSPRKFLASVKEFLNDDGILVLTSPYTWLHEYTPKSEWLGGVINDDGTPLSTFEALKDILTSNGDFELVHQSHMPFLIRETGRKHQFTFAHATVWRKL